MVLHIKKSQKRPFRGEISQKVTSMTPLIIGFYADINLHLGWFETFY